MPSLHIETRAPAYQALTTENHGPAVVVASYIFLVITATIVFARFMTKFKVTYKLAIDDYLLLGSTLCLAGQTIAITVAVNCGLGRHVESLTMPEFVKFTKVFYVSKILGFPTLTLAKASTNLLIMSIQPPKTVMLACKVTLALTIVWAFTLVFAVIFECGVPQFTGNHLQCVNQGALYFTIMGWNVSTDIALVLLPYFLMRNVQVSRQKRWFVVGLFGCRIIVPAFTIAGTVLLFEVWKFAPADLTWDFVSGAVWQQAVISFSIITACIPCIKPLLLDLSSGMMAVHIGESLEMTTKNASSSNDPVSSRASRKSLFKSKRFSSMVRSQNQSSSSTTLNCDEKDRFSTALTLAPGKAVTKVTAERSDSIRRGLTDGVIMYSIDYEVTHEESQVSGAWDDIQSSLQTDIRSNVGFSPTTSRAEKASA